MTEPKGGRAVMGEVVPAAEVLEVGAASLNELAATARREHDLVIESGRAIIYHAICAGEALLEAKKSGPSPHAYRYMRIALNKNFILESGVEKITHAEKLLSGTTYAGMSRGHRLIDLDGDILDAVRRKEMTQREAARRLGVSRLTIRNRLDGGKSNRENQRRQREARKLLRQKERADAIQAAGGGVAEAYALLRRTLQQLDRAYDEADSREVKAALRTATAQLHGAEDQIAKAVRIA